MVRVISGGVVVTGAYRARVGAVGAGRRGGRVLLVVDVGEAHVRRPDHVLAVFFVVPCVAFHSLAPDSQLFRLQRHYFEVKRQFHSSPIVAHADSKRVSKYPRP